MKLVTQIDNREVVAELGEFQATVVDKAAMLKICGVLMQASIARTFRDEGSPAGSWPKLALSTLKKKGYTTGHKLLVLTGRLFGSITYKVADAVLTIGTALSYAAVHQFGSADQSGGSVGAQARIPGRSVKVGAHQSSRVQTFKRFGYTHVLNEFGEWEKVRIRERGPANATRFAVGAHDRFQNIKARPFVVFRPEDPDRLASGVERYLAGKAARLGKATTA